MTVTKKQGCLSLALSFREVAHIGARALHVLNLIWFGNIACLSQCGGRGYFCVQMIFTYAVATRIGRGGSAPSACYQRFSFLNPGHSCP
jgi:hypothetical protein